MSRFLALLILLLPLQTNAQGSWGWARTEPGISYNINPIYPRQVIAAQNGKVLWGVLLNRKMTYRQVLLGDYALQLLDDSGVTQANTPISGKISFIQVAADASGNWYLLGSFYDTVSLGPGMRLIRGPMESEYFLMRLRAGTLIPDWLQIVGGSYYCSTPSFAVGKLGLYLPIDSGLGTKFCRFNSVTGARTDLWTQNGSTRTAFLDVDEGDNVYLSGTCLTGNYLDFNGTAGTPDSNKSYQWYIARYHSNGQHHWHYWLGDISCVPRSFSTNGAQDVVLSGALWDSTWLGPHYFVKPPRLFNSDFLFAKLDSNGYLRWAEQRPVSTVTQGNITFSSVFHIAHADTSHYLFCETSGTSLWGNGIGLQTTANRTQASLIGFGYHGLATWGRLIEANYSTAQQIATDGTDLWVTGVGMDSNAIRFDSLHLPVMPNVYVPYIAKLNLRKHPPVTGITPKVPPLCRVWPNPAGDEVTILGPENALLRIFDMTGRVMWKGVMPPRSLQIATGSWPRGVYVIDIQKNSSRELTRLVLN